MQIYMDLNPKMVHKTPQVPAKNLCGTVALDKNQINMADDVI